MLGKIYLLQSPYTDEVYIGSTIQTLEERFRKHKRPDNDTTSKIIIDEGDATIELLEEIKVIDKDELRFYEQKYLELYRDIAVNQMFAFGEDKKLKKIRDKKYREKNRDKVLERDKKYREKTKYKVECPCGSVVTKRRMFQHLKTLKHKNYVATL